MLNDSDIKNLEVLLNKEDITLSDMELIKISKLVSGMTVVQSEDHFNWMTQKGEYKHIIAPKDFDKATTTHLDEYLDINVVNLDRLGRANTTYTVKGDLLAEEDYGVPKLSELKLLIDHEELKIDLSRYTLKNSMRVLEFYGYCDQGARMMNWDIANVFNQRSTVAYLDGPQRVSVIHRTTFNGREEKASRLYLQLGDSVLVLDPSKNERLELFMRAIERFHDVGLKETSSTSVNVSQRIRAESFPGYA